MLFQTLIPRMIKKSAANRIRGILTPIPPDKMNSIESDEGENWLYHFFQYNDKMMDITVAYLRLHLPEILDGASPIDAVFYVKEIRPHLIVVWRTKNLLRFFLWNIYVIFSINIIFFKQIRSIHLSRNYVTDTKNGLWFFFKKRSADSNSSSKSIVLLKFSSPYKK